jgi:hypothetical protein
MRRLLARLAAPGETLPPEIASGPPTPEAAGRAPRVPNGPGTLTIALLVLLLALASGAVGALLVLTLRPAIPPVRVAVLDTTRIAEALAQHSGREDGVVRRFPERFDRLVRELQETDPMRLILVREAVVGSGSEDLTPLFLHELAPDARTPGPARSPRDR